MKKIIFAIIALGLVSPLVLHADPVERAVRQYLLVDEFGLGDSLISFEDSNVASQDLTIFRLTAFSHRFKDIETDGWGLNFRLPLRFGINKIDRLSDVGDIRPDSISTLGIVPRLEYQYPLPRNWVFNPRAELGINYEFDAKKLFYIGAVGVGARWTGALCKLPLELEPRIRYGNGFDNSLSTIDDYLSISAEVMTYHPRLDISFSDETALRTKLFYQLNYYLETAEIESVEGELIEIELINEVGLNFELLPEVEIWGFAMPDLKVGYRFGPDYEGIRVSIL